MPDPDENPAPSLTELGDDAARQFREGEGNLEHLRLDLTERSAEGSAIDPRSGPGHYAEAGSYARQAAEALAGEEVTRAQALAAIGQIHATLAAAAAAAVQDRVTEFNWRHVTGSP